MCLVSPNANYYIFERENFVRKVLMRKQFVEDKTQIKVIRQRKYQLLAISYIVLTGRVYNGSHTGT